jgi:hypothetical protein
MSEFFRRRARKENPSVSEAFGAVMPAGGWDCRRKNGCFDQFPDPACMPIAAKPLAGVARNGSFRQFSKAAVLRQRLRLLSASDRLVAELEFAGGHAWIVLDGEIAVPTTAVSRISTTCRTSSPGTSRLEPE